MKKLYVFLLTLVLCISLSGCTETDTEDTQSGSTESQSVNVSEATKVTESTETTNATEATESTKATEGTTAAKPVHTHTWADATCSAPKTCTACGATSGLTAGHRFSDGKCVSCGKADPDAGQTDMVWIPTKGGTKYHTKESCSGMDGPEHVTQSEAEQLGFTPCKKCCK